MRRMKKLLLATLLTALGSMAFTATVAQATTVVINGLVSGVGGELRIQAEASGPANALVGLGSDRTTPAGGDPFYCRFPLAGSINGTAVALAGAVEFSNNPEPPGIWTGVPVTVSGIDLGPGPNDPITFTFGPFVFPGTGSVVISG
jgi:opacity protein-like surface antigen